MDTSRLLFFIVMVITASECSVTATLQCKNSFIDSFKLLEGEAFYFVPLKLTESNVPDEEFTWRKNNSQIEISTNENETVHYHGGALFFLNLSSEDSGLYTGRHKRPSGNCKNYCVKIEVFKASHAMDEALLFRTTPNSAVNKKVRCPDPVSDTCKMFNGTWSWKKDSKLRQGEDKDTVWVYNASKSEEGIYTCICTWKHNNKVYKSSGSRRLVSEEITVHKIPEIISPTDKELFADEGSGIKLNCSVFCGTNVERHCHTSWELNGIPFNKTDGYSQTTTITKKPSKNTISTAVLTIDKVSAKDFQTEFKCIGKGLYEISSSALTLKPRESIIPLVIKGVCMVIFCVLATVLVKYFAIDLTLLFRSYLPHRSHTDDHSGETETYYVSVGHLFVLKCITSDAHTNVTWSRRGTNNLSLPAGVEVRGGLLYFLPVQMSHNGSYTCEKRDVTVSSGRCPEPPENKSISVGVNGGLHCKQTEILSLNDTRSIQWMKDCHPLERPESFSVGNDGFLRLTAVSKGDAGKYTCLVDISLDGRKYTSARSVQLTVDDDDGPVDYSCLPESLQYIKRKQGSLKWKKPALGTHKLTTLCSNRNFWKNLRYHMPSVPAGRIQTIV